MIAQILGFLEESGQLKLHLVLVTLAIKHHIQSKALARCIYVDILRAAHLEFGSFLVIV